jgi:hypothetical protein
MTFSKLDRLLLLGHGPADQVQALLGQAGPQLAAALALHWAGCLAAQEPRTVLSDLPRGLAAVPCDPGQTLLAGDHWAEALGAWRQPVLVLLTPDQVAWGMAAASTALLQQQRVPLVGLVQAGGVWQADLRAREGLPWLGQLDGGADSPLTAALALRWCRLEAELLACPQG